MVRIHLGALLQIDLPYQVSLEEPTRTIVIKGSGSGSTADALQLIQDLRQTFLDHPGCNVLYDSSQLAIDSSPADMMKIAQLLFEESGVVLRKIAVVVPEERMALARIFSALAHPHGVSADVFTHVSDARTWLGIDR